MVAQARLARGAEAHVDPLEQAGRPAEEEAGARHRDAPGQDPGALGLVAQPRSGQGEDVVDPGRERHGALEGRPLDGQPVVRRVRRRVEVAHDEAGGPGAPRARDELRELLHLPEPHPFVVRVVAAGLGVGVVEVDAPAAREVDAGQPDSLARPPVALEEPIPRVAVGEAMEPGLADRMGREDPEPVAHGGRREAHLMRQARAFELAPQDLAIGGDEGFLQADEVGVELAQHARNRRHPLAAVVREAVGVRDVPGHHPEGDRGGQRPGRRREQGARPVVHRRVDAAVAQGRQAYHRRQQGGDGQPHAHEPTASPARAARGGVVLGQALG